MGRIGSKAFMGTVMDGSDAIYAEGGGIVSARGRALFVVRRGMGKAVAAGERLRLGGWYRKEWPYTVSVSSFEARLHELNSLCLLSCFGSF